MWIVSARELAAILLSLAFAFDQAADEPTRLLPPAPPAPGKVAPGPGGPGMTARERALLATVQGIRAEMEKRLAPNSVYMRESPNANPNFPREMLARAIFETLPLSHGDKGLLMEAITELKSVYSWINIRVAHADLDWIIREKSRWLESVIDRLSAGRAAAGSEVRLKAEPIPSSFFITTGTGIHRAYKDISSNELEGLRQEARYLRGNIAGFDLSARYVAEALRFELENPAEAELNQRFKAGRTLDPRFFYARLWQAVFLNVEKFYGDSALLNEALDLLSQDVPDVTRVKDAILHNLGTIKRERIRWFDDSVLPAVWELEHPRPRPNQGMVMASSQLAPAAEVQLPRVAWILSAPGPENVPRRSYSGHPLLKTTNEMLRSLQ